MSRRNQTGVQPQTTLQSFRLLDGKLLFLPPGFTKDLMDDGQSFLLLEPCPLCLFKVP